MQGLECFHLEKFGWDFAGLSVDTNIGHLIHPITGGDIDALEIGEFQTIEEVLFDVADGIFHPPFGPRRELRLINQLPNNILRSLTRFIPGGAVVLR